MQRVIRIGLVAVMLSTPAVLHAAEFWHYSYVLRVHPLADGTIILMFTSDSGNCASVANPKAYRVALGQNGVTADGLRAIQATALTALATGALLEVAFDDSTTNCYVNRVAIRG